MSIPCNIRKTCKFISVGFCNLKNLRLRFYLLEACKLWCSSDKELILCCAGFRERHQPISRQSSN